MIAFIELVHQCFSNVLRPGGYKNQLKVYAAVCAALSVRKIPVKMHIVVAHLHRNICETRRGLGLDSEQLMEAAHHGFHVIWERFYVRDTASKTYASQLTRALLTYNAFHTPISQNKK